MSKKEQLLGIMTRIWGNGTFFEKSYYKELTLIGQKMGIRVFVFSPKQVDFEQRRIIGYEYRMGAWRQGVFPFPQTVYDRCFLGPKYQEYKPFVEMLQNDPSITFLGKGLFGKWQVHRLLEKSAELARYLPETHLLSANTLRQMLSRDRAAIVKPAAGTKGAGVMLINAEDSGYQVSGRNRHNRLIHFQRRSFAALKRLIDLLAAGRPYLVQQYISSKTPEGFPFDIRVLVQKDGEGHWQTTGKAVRLGEKDAVTSNLHGGGKAFPFDPFMVQLFPDDVRKQIETDIEEIARLLPPYLEQHHGRLVELGIDLAIDPHGKVWILEVNSRPGRNVFRLINDEHTRIRSIMQPIRYARHLMKERVGGF